MPGLPTDELGRLADLARQARGDILAMTTLAGSGHPGGSLSSIDTYIVLWNLANVSPSDISSPSRDRVVASHGHTAAAVYAALGRLGFFDPADAVNLFRKPGSPFEGHADPKVPGVEWACGNLGQGLSAACGFALGSRLTGPAYRVYCVMGDGEQQKGQVSEARRFAAKYRLDNLTALVDCNDLQAMGRLEDIMPMDLRAEWQAAGWQVLEADGHDHAALHEALCAAGDFPGSPTVVLARTIMGKGVSFMENRYEYHGKVLSPEECRTALRELGLSDGRIRPDPSRYSPPARVCARPIEETVLKGIPRSYDDDTDCRTAFGNALADLGRINDRIPIAVFDCDLAGATRTDRFAAERPEGFFQCGIQEHSTATIAGAVSMCGVLSFFADFGVFGLDETYNQHRLNDINQTSLKLVCTHCGLDVGHDGKTHQCIDYVALPASLHGFKLVIAADANQAGRMTRFAASTPGNILLAMGRSKLPVIMTSEATAFYAGDYEFRYGVADWIREGSDGTIVTCGNMVHRAVDVSGRLAESGMRVGVLNLTCPLDLDESRLRAAADTGFVITYEDHNVRTGIGSLVASYLAENSIHCAFLRLGVSKYGVSGTPEENYRIQGLDAETVVQRIMQRKRDVRE